MVKTSWKKTNLSADLQKKVPKGGLVQKRSPLSYVHFIDFPTYINLKRGRLR